MKTKKDLFQEIKIRKPYHNALYQKLDEIAFAQLFGDIIKDFARYDPISKSWRIFNGVKWERDPEDLILGQQAKLFQEVTYRYSATISDENNPERLRAFRKAVNDLSRLSKRKALIEDAKSVHPVPPGAFDNDVNGINLKNGFLSFTDFKLYRHDPGQLLSKVANVEFDPSVPTDEIEAIVREIMQGDREKVEYIQQLFGLSLTIDTSQEQAFIFYGPTSRNGKSTLLNTFGDMLGDYAVTMAPESLARRERNARNASGDIARLQGVRFVHLSEPPKHMILDSALLKTMIGRDKIVAREMYEKEREFFPEFKLFINTNHLPHVTDDSLFASERLKVIEFNRHFTPEEQDRGLKRRLMEPQNLSALLNWSIEGLKKYQAAGAVLRDPDAVHSATERYRQDSDKFGQFISENLEQTLGLHVSIKDAYNAFASWCHENGFGTDSKKSFIAEMKLRGLHAATGTINGKTVFNVIPNHVLRCWPWT